MILKSLRKNTFINLIVRRVLKGLLNITSTLTTALVKRWPVSGAVDCSFNNIPFKMYNACDDGLVNFFYYNLPYHEENDLKLFLSLAHHSKTIVDIGANTGLYSILSSIKKTESVIHAVEPYSINANRLRKNITLNNCKNITVNQVAIGDFKGEIELTVPEDGTVTDVSSLNSDFSKRVYPDIKWVKEKVSITTLDDFTKERAIKVDLIKCDVESHEMEVFNGAKEVLKSHRPVIIFECFLDETRRNFFNALLNEFNYHAFAILKEGLLHLDKGFVDTPDTLNYLLAPVKPSASFLNFKNMSQLTEQLMNVK